MKKAIIAGLLGFSVLFVACGPKKDDAAEKAKLDSIAKADSTRKADSTAQAAAAAATPVDTTKKDTAAAKVEAPKAEEKKK